MTIYTAADFRDARFAEHPDGRVAARTGVDWAQWAFKCSECETDEEREECDGHDFGPDGYMASNGWVPVQENPRPLAADDFGQMEAAWKAADNDMAPNDGDTLIIWKGRDWWEIGVALPGRPMDRRIARVLHRPPSRPKGAEKVEAVLHQYWSGDINGDDLADRIAEEMNR